MGVSTTNISQIRPIVCDLRNYFICFKENPEAEEACPVLEFNNRKYVQKITHFIQTAPSSKYLYPKEIFTTMPNHVPEICSELGLQPATIQTLADFKHLVEQFLGDHSNQIFLIIFFGIHFKENHFFNFEKLQQSCSRKEAEIKKSFQFILAAQIRKEPGFGGTFIRKSSCLFRCFV